MGILSILRPAEYSLILLIDEYLRENGRRGFTYRGLRKYWSIKKLYAQHDHTLHEWHTVERSVRSLAEKGFLIRKMFRKNGKKIVVFYPSYKFYSVLEARDKIIGRSY